MKSLNNNVPSSLNRGKYEFWAALTLLQLPWFGSKMVQYEFALIIVGLMNVRWKTRFRYHVLTAWSINWEMLLVLHISTYEQRIIKSEYRKMVRPMIRLFWQHFKKLLLMVLLVYWKCLLVMGFGLCNALATVCSSYDARTRSVYTSVLHCLFGRH